jgi:hypothetical protein
VSASKFVHQTKIILSCFLVFSIERLDPYGALFGGSIWCLGVLAGKNQVFEF